MITTQHQLLKFLIYVVAVIYYLYQPRQHIEEQRRRSVTAVHGGKAGPGSHIWMWQAGPKEGRREVKVVQSCPTLCDPMDYTVHGTLQARILEWVVLPFSRGSSQPRD